MRYQPEEIHPVLWKATDDLNNRWMMGDIREEDRRVLPAHQRIWMAHYLKPMLRSMIGPGLLVLTGAAMQLSSVNLMPLPAKAFIGAGLAWAVFTLIVQLTKNNREVASSELATLLPILDLSGLTRTYADTVVAIGDATHLSREEKSELLKGLCRVMDEHQRIEAARGSLTAGDGIDAIAAELDVVDEKLSVTEDAETRAFYVESRHIFVARAEQARVRDQSLSRLDAQATLLNQSVRQLHDAVRRPAHEFGMSNLRDNLAVIQTRSDEIERAVAELDA